MATSSSSVIRQSEPVHAGVERVIEGANAVRDTVKEASAGRRLPSYMVGLTVMLIVTLTARALDESQVGFATELLALSAVALFAFVFLSSAVRTLTRLTQSAVSSVAEAVARTLVQERLWAHAAQDSRVMNDILWAQSRDESVLVNEVRAPSHASQREINAERRIPAPIFTKYY